MKKVIAVTAVTAMCVPAVALAKNYVKVNPEMPYQGTQVKISGTTGPHCGPGTRVTIYSHAFAEATSHKWKGVPALYAKVRSNHKWSTKVTISINTTAARWYRVTARCTGGTLGHTRLYVQNVY